MLNRFLLAVTLACVCGMVGSVFVGREGNAARVEAATGACELTDENFEPPRIRSEPFKLGHLTAVGTNSVWIDGGYGYDYHSWNSFVLEWDGAEWKGKSYFSMGVGGSDLIGGSGPKDVWRLAYDVMEHWDGEKWERGYALERGGYSAIFARTPDDAWMTGTASPADRKNMFAHWDGSAWRGVRGPRFDNTIRLNAIVVVSRDNAWAVGARYTVDGTRAVLLKWDGVEWRKVRSPARRNTEWFALTALGKDDIWAVGRQMIRGNSAAITMHWDGTGWKAVGIRLPENFGGQSALSSVAALASDNVWAAGETGDGSLLVRWDGTRWHRQIKPGDIDSIVEIVAEGTDRLWIMSREQIVKGDGVTWSPGNLPWFGSYTGELRRVEVLSKDDVWALGSAVEHWDGTEWSVVQIPTDVAPAANYTGLDGHAPDGVWLVGDYTNGAGKNNFVVRWDGSGWARLPDPYNGAPTYRLNDIAVLAPDDIWVGGYGDGWTRVAIHWDGQGWTETPMPHRQSEYPGIVRLYGTAADDVWALGSDILHWDGTEWSVAYPAWATALTALGPGEVWASTRESFLHFDGTQWQIVPKAQPSHILEYAALVPIAPDDIYAVGSRHQPWDVDETEIQHWNGKEWQIDKFYPREVGFAIADVSAVRADEFWTVGTRHPTYNFPRAVIHRFTRTCE